MLHIITLLLCTSFSLFSMELAKIESSNSSSEIYFFSQHISQNYCLPTDIKHKLLTTYIALTNDERHDSNRYNELINVPNYMNLNKHNKHYIQRLCSTTETPMKIHDINNNKQIILGDFPDAHIDYQKMLQLPLNIRRTIASKYSSMIFVKTTGKILDHEQVKDQETDTAYKSGTLITLSTYVLLHVFFPEKASEIMLWIAFAIAAAPPLLWLPHIAYDKLHPLTSTEELKYYYYNGYKSLPLLREENEK